MYVLSMSGRSRRRHRWQKSPRIPRDPSKGLPSSGGHSSDRRSKRSSQHSTWMKASEESIRSVRVGIGLRVKINLPIFKDEKTKEVVLEGYFLNNRTILDLVDKLLPVSNMASSGLKKMLDFLIL